MKNIRIIVKDISASLSLTEDDVFEIAKKKIISSGLDLKLRSCSVFKRSVDARKKDNIRFVYSVSVDCSCSLDFDLSSLSRYGFSVVGDEAMELEFGTQAMNNRPVVVGMGPAGMFAALLLSEHGYRPILIERGDNIENRLAAKDEFYKEHILDTESNIQFGAGGAGTFSDGKLVTRINDVYCSYALSVLNQLGAPDDILIKAKAHIGTDNLLTVVKNMDAKIRDLGGEILYRTRLDDIRFDSNGNVRSIIVNRNTEIMCGCLILCPGHSARDTYQMLLEKDIAIIPKAFSVGVRIEHLREDIDSALYGRFASHPKLGAAEYNLSHNTKSRGVYTFCMCPGGEVVAATSEEGGVVVNGMSNYRRDGLNSNSAVAVSVFESDYGATVEGAIDFQRRLERSAFNMGGGNYAAPITTLGDFFDKRKGTSPNRVKPTYMNGENCCLADFSSFMPDFIYTHLRDGLSAFDKKVKGFSSRDAILTAYETRTSAPVRILRDEHRNALGHENLFPCGEGAGYAGGITSAAVDGIRTAIEIMRRYSPAHN